jgi:hypothetical protein
VREVIDTSDAVKAATLGVLWIKSPKLLKDPINPGQFTDVIVRLVIRTDGHGPKRSYTHAYGSDSTEFVTATFASQPAVPGCEQPIILDLRYVSCYCGFCSKHYREHGADVVVPEHDCMATSTDMAAQAESGALTETSCLLTDGFDGLAYFTIGVLIADGDLGSLPAVKKGAIQGLEKLGASPALARQILRDYPIARIGTFPYPCRYILDAYVMAPNNQASLSLLLRQVNIHIPLIE